MKGPADLETWKLEIVGLEIRKLDIGNIRGGLVVWWLGGSVVWWFGNLGGSVSQDK